MLTDPAISYPLRPDIVSLPVVAIVSLLGPAAIIAFVNLGGLILHRHKTHTNEASELRRDRTRIALWELHAGWLGLCAGLASTLLITAGLKDIIGKPRPNLLSRCDPDLTNIAAYVVGGFGMNLDSEAPPFVTSAICTQKDKRFLGDGFAAFPSGHSSFSSAGMVYLTLWLCARWRIHIPHANFSRLPQKSKMSRLGNRAPPLWQVTIAFVPILVALFISSSRYADFHHAGSDIIAGMVLGTLLGWTSFRLYHPSARYWQRSMAWKARDAGSAFIAYDYRADTNDEEQSQRRFDTELEFIGTNRAQRAATDNSRGPILSDTATRA